MTNPKQAPEISYKLVDEGRLIEAGFEIMRSVWSFDHNMTAADIEFIRTAFFAGALHTFTNITNMLRSNRSNDKRSMDKIKLELDAYGREFNLRNKKTDGTA